MVKIHGNVQRFFSLQKENREIKVDKKGTEKTTEKKEWLFEFRNKESPSSKK